MSRKAYQNLLHKDTYTVGEYKKVMDYINMQFKLIKVPPEYFDQYQLIAQVYDSFNTAEWRKHHVK